jgi:hypothetical protein
LDNGDCHQYEGKDFGHHVISLMMVYDVLTGMDICILYFVFVPSLLLLDTKNTVLTC